VSNVSEHARIARVFPDFLPVRRLAHLISGPVAEKKEP
jgi:hypothetical protein